jgi:hypothetical protein
MNVGSYRNRRPIAGEDEKKTVANFFSCNPGLAHRSPLAHKFQPLPINANLTVR